MGSVRRKETQPRRGSVKWEGGRPQAVAGSARGRRRSMGGGGEAERGDGEWRLMVDRKFRFFFFFLREI